MAKILVVEDDKALSETVEEWLTLENHVVDVANDGLRAKDCMSAFDYDLYVLDWELPKLSGIDLCQHIRSQGKATPILMLTGKSQIDDKEVGFESGADDYLTKPFHPRELMARVRALLRRPESYVKQDIVIGDLKICTASREVTHAGKPLRLQPMEFTLLEFFARHPNEVFSVDTLIRKVWDSNAEVSDASVYTCLARLRGKLEDAGSCPISTIRGVGYVLKL